MIYILIPCHDNKAEVLELLECLDKQRYGNFKVVLVDDGSRDGTAEEVADRFPAVVILKGKGNLWWTGANVLGVNHILKKSDEKDFVLLLNNDLIIEKNYLKTLVSVSVENDRAIVGSALADYSDPKYLEGGVQLSERLELTVNRDWDSIKNSDCDFDIDVLPGRGTLVPVEVFRKIGNFNRRMLPHYGADYEFSIRAKKAGFRLIVSHKAIVYGKLDITGIETPTAKRISLRECAALLFSKKSKTNFLYYLNYVWLCSDKKHRKKNLLRNAGSILSETVGKTSLGWLYSSVFYMCASAYRLFRLKGRQT